MLPDSFKKIKIQNKEYDIADISKIENIEKIPFTYRILIENIIRQKFLGKNEEADTQVNSILEKNIGSPINFAPNRILSHDILGKVMLVDFIAYREALQKKGIDAKDIQPDVPVDLVIDHSLQVDYYGNATPLSQVANLGIPDSQTITIQPWDIGILMDVEKCIQTSDLGLNPSNDGKIIRLTIPPLTGERRKELVKILKILMV